MNQEIYIPLKISTHKGRAAVVVKPHNYFANTPLARLLAKAEMLEAQLIKSARDGITLKQFCQINKISPRYVRSIMATNNLSPKIKQCIMDGNVPRCVTVQGIGKYGVSLCWREQEMWFFDGK